MKLDYHNGFRTALMVTLASVVALAADADDPWWAAMSAMTVANADWTNVWRKGVQRLFGTIAGAVFGYTLAIMFRNIPIFQVIAIGGLAALAIYKRMASPDYSYAWLLGTITAMLAIYISVVEINALFSKMVDRSVTVLIGVGVATVVMYWLTKGSSIKVGFGPIGISRLEEVDYSWVMALCITGAIVAIAAPIIYVKHDLIAMVQITITSLVVLYGPVQEVKKVALNRLVGCLMGGLLGLFLVMLGLQSFFWWVIGVFCGLFFLCALHHSKSYWAYAGTQGGYAFVIAVLTSSGPVNDIEGVLDRLVGVVLGAVLGIAVLYAVRVWQGAEPRNIEHIAREHPSQKTKD
ncbi:FUSC family protein [Pseudovibrio sp. Ad37]|uniref:FUSC family protein n=1 Tax=Pseudovibrio sp. Ad37 TaxID=989422 RepID=UPI0007AEE51B|nr:FUSC family protein [Pseudovibrio sp. Ad37]KZL15060.1 multidrug efflux system protein MdtO [Pseudovibrio sp. Ad37]